LRAVVTITTMLHGPLAEDGRHVALDLKETL
jgi:hypothetical protein